MLLQSHLLSAVSGENDAVIQEFWLVDAAYAKLVYELHKCKTCQ